MGIFASKPVPTPTPKMREVINKLKLVPKDLAQLNYIFRKHDKDNSGTVDLGEFYKMIEEKRSVFGDGIFEMIDITDTGKLNFTEFVEAIMTYGMFEKEEVLKYCFFVFDKDKNGYVEEEEIMALFDILHDHEIKGNLKTAIKKFDVNSDGKVDFEEFKQMHAQFPTMIYPAFRLQQNMHRLLLGKDWWYKKQVELNDDRENERNRTVRLRIKEEKRLLAIKRRQMWSRYGNVKGCFLMFCPSVCCEFAVFDALIQPEGLGADMDADETHGEQESTELSEYDKMLAEYGRDFTRNAELLAKLNKFYNDISTLRHDSLAVRTTDRKERTRRRRDGRIEIGQV